jgi:hypothetical protein
MEYMQILLGGLGGLAVGVTFWLKSEKKDGKLEEFEFLKMARQVIFGAVGGIILASQGLNTGTTEVSLLIETLGAGSAGLLLDNITKVIWRRFGKKIAEKLGFLG